MQFSQNVRVYMCKQNGIEVFLIIIWIVQEKTFVKEKWDKLHKLQS